MFRDPGTNEPLDEGLALWLPGPGSATGEDLAEMHLHGGRAVVSAVLACLTQHDGLRPARAGEFTRRAFENGRIDLAQAEGLADLLAAETELQRQSALAMTEGAMGRRVTDWQARLLRASAQVEAELDFSDESEVGKGTAERGLGGLADEMAALLAVPPAERLRDGVRVVLAGPPNSGKSSLFNALIERHAAIVTDIAGTTRDVIEAPVVLGGVPLILIDTAGLHDASTDAVELIGIARTGVALAAADIILWLGAAVDCPVGALLIAPKCDLAGAAPGLAVSATSGEGLDTLRAEMIERARDLLPRPGALAINARQRTVAAQALAEVKAASYAHDLLIVAEHLRAARTALDALTGRAGVEDMLDALFGAFCIGK